MFMRTGLLFTILFIPYLFIEGPLCIRHCSRVPGDIAVYKEVKNHCSLEAYFLLGLDRQ